MRPAGQRFAFAAADAGGKAPEAGFETRLRNLFLAVRDIPRDGRFADEMTMLSPGAATVARPLDAEADLIARARTMEAGAWDELYTAHYAAVFRYCAFRIPAPDAAEDVAAEVFLEAVRGIGRYQYRGTPIRAWLYRIAHNLTADERRRLARRGSVEIAGDASEPAEGDFAPGLAARRDLQVALAKLTEDQQQVVILRFLEGLSLAEAATVMKRPAGAIKSLQHRAVLRLRAIMEGEVG